MFLGAVLVFLFLVLAFRGFSPCVSWGGAVLVILGVSLLLFACTLVTLVFFVYPRDPLVCLLQALVVIESWSEHRLCHRP